VNRTLAPRKTAFSSADSVSDVLCDGLMGQKRCTYHVRDDNASRYRFCKEYRTHSPVPLRSCKLGD
jgi:hypothetical protein